MDRRSFIRQSSGALTAALIFSSPVTLATPPNTAVNGPASTYRIRVRFRRFRNSVSLWVRVTQLGNTTKPIPFTVFLATGERMQDVIASEQQVANPRTSFMVDKRFPVQADGPVYLKVRLTDRPTISSRVWKIEKKKKNRVTTG